MIGNAPSAALMVCSMVERGLRPALVVATPVGFVNELVEIAIEGKKIFDDKGNISSTMNG